VEKGGDQGFVELVEGEDRVIVIAAFDAMMGNDERYVFFVLYHHAFIKFMRLCHEFNYRTTIFYIPQGEGDIAHICLKQLTTPMKS